MAATQSGAMPLSDEDPRRQPAEREQQRPRIGENCKPSAYVGLAGEFDVRL